MTHRAMIVVGCAALALILIAVGFIYLKGGSTPVSVDDAVRRFNGPSTPSSVEVKTDPGARDATSTGTATRASTTSSRSTTANVIASSRAIGRPLPPEGVYVYATAGGDHVDVLGGSGHTYPSQTTITIKRSGCGLLERWDALKERWDERESCHSANGDLLHRTTTYHEFFRHGDLRTYMCDGYTYPAGAKPGDTWTGHCRSGASVATNTARAVGWAYVDVGGTRIRTLHVHVDTKLSGEQVGTSTHDVWGSAQSGLNLREIETVDSWSNQPVFGKTHYQERYELRIVSSQPRR